MLPHTQGLLTLINHYNFEGGGPLSCYKTNQVVKPIQYTFYENSIYIDIYIRYTHMSNMHKC